MTALSPISRSPRAAVKNRSFPQTLAWRLPLPAGVRPDEPWGEETDNWRRWNRHLQERPPAFFKLDEAAGKTWSLLWGACEAPTSELLALLRPVPSIKRRRASLARAAEFARPWLAESAGLAGESPFAWECLAWCRAMPELAASVPCDEWWELLKFLIDVASDVPAEDPADALSQLLLAAELPLSLAGAFPEIDECSALGPVGQRAAVAAAVKLLDGEGLPHARHFPLLRPLLACWTRCRLLPSWSPVLTPLEEDPTQWSHFVRHALRFSRGDGTSLFSATSGDDRQLIATALATVDDLLTQRLAQESASKPAARKPATKPLAKKHPAKRRAPPVEPPLPEAGYESDWSEASLLRTDWSRQAHSLAVTYHDRVVTTELLVRGEPFWSGPWGLEATFNGEALSPISPWTSVCWFSDADADYVELEVKLDQGVKVQRQLLLARKDQFLFLSDCLLAPEVGELAYRGTLPISSDVQVVPAGESRELRLQRGRRRLLAIPPALPEWRRDPRGGTFTVDGQGLHLQQSAHRQALYCPLFIDLDGKRNGGPLTWRQLTVAQDRRSVPADVAAGYRVQVGKEQFVFYRSLGPPANRTLLGCNLVTECMAGRFTKDGEVKTILEIE